jgi:hypothetical protein
MSKTSITPERQQAHSLLDLLPVEKLPAVVHLLQALTDPLARSLANAPFEDEPISASKAWLSAHTPIPHYDVLAELGLTPEDFERMARTPLDSAPGR